MADDEDVAPRAPAGNAPIKCETRLFEFEDHMGQSATTVWLNKHYSTLPPLVAHIIYFVNPSTPHPLPDDSAIQLDTTIRNGMVYGDHYRLEYFYLPGATVQDCIQHHTAERSARGDYTRHFEAVKNNERPKYVEGVSNGDVFDPSYRPGLPTSYQESGDMMTNYNQMFFTCHSASWDEGDGLLEQIEYDAIPPEEFAQYLDEEELAEHPERATLPWQKRGSWRLIVPQDLMARSRQLQKPTVYSGYLTVDQIIADRSLFQAYGMETESIYQQAERTQWVHW